MKLRVGMPLATKNGQRYSNAVVYKIAHGKHRDIITVLTDYGDIQHFPSVDDLFVYYDVSSWYINQLRLADDMSVDISVLDNIYDLKRRLQNQIELLKSALEGLE